MAKLNTRELTVLKKEVEKMIEESKAQFRLSAEYTRLVTKVKKDMKHSKIELHIKNIVSVNNKVHNLIQQRNDMFKELTNITGSSAYWHNTVDKDTLGNRVDSLVEKAISANYPKSTEIEDKLVLLNLQGSTDILNLIKIDLGL